MAEVDVSTSVAIIYNGIHKYQGPDTPTGHWAGFGTNLGGIHGRGDT